MAKVETPSWLDRARALDHRRVSVVIALQLGDGLRHILHQVPSETMFVPCPLSC